MIRLNHYLLFVILWLAAAPVAAIYQFQQILATNDTTDLGRSIALDDESVYMALGTTNQTVLIYKLQDDSWKLDQRLRNKDNDGFGWSVAMDGRYMAVGAPMALNKAGNQTGAVFICRQSVLRHRWEFQQTVWGDELYGKEFGHAVAMHQQQLIVSDRRHFQISANAGSAVSARLY